MLSTYIKLPRAPCFRPEGHAQTPWPGVESPFPSGSFYFFRFAQFHLLTCTLLIQALETPHMFCPYWLLTLWLLAVCLGWSSLPCLSPTPRPHHPRRLLFILHNMAGCIHYTLPCCYVLSHHALFQRLILHPSPRLGTPGRQEYFHSSYCIIRAERDQ